MVTSNVASMYILWALVFFIRLCSLPIYCALTEGINEIKYLDIRSQPTFDKSVSQKFHISVMYALLDK
jgi:hypothetical protein